MSSLLSTHPKSFVHLHLHTQYSLLDGALRIKDLMSKCKEFGMPAVASTDHGNMFGAIDFYQQAKGAGIKPLIGSEIYFTPGSRFDKKSPKISKTLDSQDENESKHHIHHLVLICKNLEGYRNLCQLLSKAYLEGFYYKPRVDVELLKQYSKGLVATTACLKGEVSYNFFTGQDDRAVEAIMKYREIFGDDFYMEIQENGLPEQKDVNLKLIKFAQNLSIPLVATNDVHYLTRDDAAAQEVLLCIQTGKTFLDEKRMKLTTNEFFLKSPEQMRQAFNYFEEACDNTLRIADKCNLEFKWTNDKGQQIYHLPNFPIQTQESLEDYFRREAKEGLEKRFNGPHFKKLKEQNNWETELKPQYEKRLTDETEMIIRMGFAGYFLIVSDFIRYAKEKNIPVGPGRGSGAGSLVAYAMDITNINPLPFNLLFERFINPERVSLPDFDVDFCQDRRGEVIDYVTNKYGQERVGQIITFGKLQAKAVIRDVSRVFGLPYSEADVISKLIPEELGITLEKAIETEPKLKELIESDQKIRKIVDISKRLEGLLRHASIHAAGVIITNEPLVSYAPLYRGRDGEQVVQFDKDFSEKIGLVKFDFLGLKTLTVIQNAVNLIRRDIDPYFDIEGIDMEDRKVFDLISSGNTSGVFQLESSGMKELCKRIKPDTIDDITAINALYRPGPLGSGMVDDFVEIKHGRKQTQYPFPELEPVLKDTYGIIVYQEQVMNIARIVASYSLGQADMLRRAMGKKKPEEMEKHKSIFCDGAKKNNFDVQKAADLYDLMAKFAEYGFNKSHAVAYAVIAYQTAFLKTYYPAYFFSALLGSEMDNTDKITGYIQDAKENGMEILPPDINESLWSFNVLPGNKIRFGMGAVKNVGEGAVEAIVREREAHGAYTGFISLCERVDQSSINKRVLESLIKVGAFDKSEKFNRKTLLENLEMITSYAQKNQKEKASGQVSLFDFGGATVGVMDTLDVKEFPDFEEKEKLSYEAELIGIYVSGHPLNRYQAIMKQVASTQIYEVESLEGQDKREVVLAGLIVEQKALLTKKGDKMCFAKLQDLTGKLEAVIFPKVYEEFHELISSDEPLAMTGYINLAETPRKFFPNKVFKLQEYAEQKIQALKIVLSPEDLSDKNLELMKKTLLGYRGQVPVYIIVDHQEGKARIPLGPEYSVMPQAKLAAGINDVFAKNAVQLVVEGKNHETTFLD
jgi:DNA polymerase-3 subunit alpha